MKYLSVLLCLVLCVTSLAGCGEGGSVPSGGTNDIADDRTLDFRLCYDYYAVDEPFSKVTERDGNTYPAAPAALSADALAAFESYLDGTVTPYTYAHLYGIDEALAAYDSIRNSRVTTHDITISDVSSATLFERVKQNNAAFLSQKQEEYTSSFYEEFSDEELEKICDIVSGAVTCYMEAGLIEDTAELRCIMGDLKIFATITMTNAYVDDNNVLFISPDMIGTLNIKTFDDDQDVYVSTIAHETMHMLQKGCTHNNEIVYAIGNAYKFDDLEVNPFFWRWFYEGAAEKLVLNCTGYVPIVYEFYINYINSLTLSVMLDDDVALFDAEQSTLSNALEPLFALFDCQTAEEQQEILAMMFSLDFIETDNEDFKKAVDPDMTEEEIVAIKRDLKNSVCETLTKAFYSRLAKHCAAGNCTWQDVFGLITVFEHDVNSHINLNDEERRLASLPFTDRYTAVQNRFFDALAASNGMTADEVTALFDGYGLCDAEGNKNLTLSFLPQEKQDFVTFMQNATHSDAFTAVRDYR